MIHSNPAQAWAEAIHASAAEVSDGRGMTVTAQSRVQATAALANVVAYMRQDPGFGEALLRALGNRLASGTGYAEIRRLEKELAEATQQLADRKPRRERVEGHPGIYQRAGKDGAVSYEITWTDDDGKQRWRTIGPSLEEAIAAKGAVSVEGAAA